MENLMRPLAMLGRTGAIVAVAVALFAGGLGVGSGLSSTGAQANDEIHGCVSIYTGNLRIVNDAAQCASSERPLSWSQQGAGNVLDTQLVRETLVINTEDETDRAYLKADCPADYRVVGGGAGRSFSSAVDIVYWFMESSSPGIKGDPNFPDNDGWSTTFRTLDGEDAEGQYGFFIEAICVPSS